VTETTAREIDIAGSGYRPSTGRLHHRGRLLWQIALRHPHAAVFGLALLTRVAVAVLTVVLQAGYLVGDEQQYLGLATFVADGRGAEAWFPGYGQSLYESTLAFSGPLSALFWAFGPHLLWFRGAGPLPRG
jgi:hypothetical protein